VCSNPVLTRARARGQVNHAVLAVGYGAEGGADYWTIKNSWGFGWGDHGHFKMLRNANMCAVAECASFPILAKD